MPLLWAVLPVVVINVLERIAFGTTHFCDFMRYRLIGTLSVAFDFGAHGVAPVVRPLHFLATPGLWGGLLVAAALLVLAIRLRRNREPI